MNETNLFFSKGFQSAEQAREFQQAIVAGNSDQLYAISKENPAVRKPVDACVFTTPCKDMDIYTDVPLPYPPIASKEFDDAHKELMKLAKLRDVRIGHSSVSCLEPIFKRPSYFMREWQVEPYKRGVDYLTTIEEWTHIQRGGLPSRQQLRASEKTRKFKTLRDYARYVHDDSPSAVWIAAVKQMLALGVDHIGKTSYQTNFVCYGMPFWEGAINEVVRRAGAISFRSKWSELVPRPEQYYYERFGEFLPITYAEGSPMHPSLPQMHQFVAESILAFLRLMFDVDHIIKETQTTVGYELMLIRDTSGIGRLVAGVHSRLDHEAGRERSIAIGERVALENINKDA